MRKPTVLMIGDTVDIGIGQQFLPNHSGETITLKDRKGGTIKRWDQQGNAVVEWPNRETYSYEPALLRYAPARLGSDNG